MSYSFEGDSKMVHKIVGILEDSLQAAEHVSCEGSIVLALQLHLDGLGLF